MHGSGRCLRAGDSAKRTVTDLEPRRSRQSQPRQRNGDELVVGDAVWRDHGDANRARPPEQRLSQRIIGLAERNSEQHPADDLHRTRIGDEPPLLRALSAARVPGLVRQIDDVSLPLLGVALGAGEVDDVVRINVFLVEAVVVHRAVGLRIAEKLSQSVAATARREGVVRRRHRRAGDGIEHGCERVDDITRQPPIVGCGVERAGERIALAVERIESLDASPSIRRVAVPVGQRPDEH